MHIHIHIQTHKLRTYNLYKHIIHVHKHIHVCHTIYMLLASYLHSKEQDLS